MMAGLFAAAELDGREIAQPPADTALGALLSHITGDADAESYQPMNVNFGLFPPVGEDVRKKQRKLAYTDRARASLADWMATLGSREPA
jgi:methylenetetrahydrofolate--tRNA-(uracil-5-)-methyltransferase